MGTVLSFSPRERRPIYTTHHHGSGTISTSTTNSEFPMNNYAYEQINNAKNRENTKPMNLLTVPSQFQHGHNGNNLMVFGGSNSTNIMNNNHQGNSIEERAADSARILQEKNALEKNMKKHSLFINALSWKRLSASHGKKKQESNNSNNVKNKVSASFRPAGLTDVVHPMACDKNKKYQQQQVQFASSNNNNNNNNNNSNLQQHQQQQPSANKTIYFTPGDPKSLLALDLERASNNANNLQHMDKLGPKIQLPLKPTAFQQQSTTHHEQRQQQHGPKKTIIQEYEVLEALGKGGFATVYRAKCHNKNQDVAIKMIDKKLMQAYQMTDRVRQEVAIHARLKHPSILELFTFFEDVNYVYLVLELADNGALHRYLIDSQKPLNEYEAANILSQVLDGLMYLHSNNIMHRDMSMSNLLLTATMTIKIADFGLATQLDQLVESKHTTLCGTPNYISPEVASRSNHGLPADVWSLGCLLYTLLVGRAPFDTNGVKSTLTQVVLGHFTIPDHISADARDLISKLLCKDPKKRIQLQQVLTHPFMFKSKQRQQYTVDSGIMTLSSMGKSQRSRSEERSNVFTRQYQQQSHEIDQVVGSASMYRAFSGLSINQMPAKSTSYHSQHQQLIIPEPKITVQPLTTIRLQPTRHKTKNAILSIINDGEVVIEFIKYKSRSHEERINDVCRISSDGLRIVLYQPKSVIAQDHPPELPIDGADHIYSYENLPQKHWKKYLYAHRFVQMVRAKTPKVTFYSEQAKCQLMEDLNDFEINFYKGGKVLKNITNGFKLENAGICGENMLEHAEKCYCHCIQIEKTMSSMSMEFPCFPVIIGRRPTTEVPVKQPPKDNTYNNYISSSQTPVRPPKITMPSYSIDHTPASSFKMTPFALTNPRMPETPPQTPGSYSHKAMLPGIDHAVHLANGVVQIQYIDGTQISVLAPEQGGGILFSSSTTLAKHQTPIHYNENDLMPDVVRAKFKQLPIVLKQLTNDNFEHSTPLHHHHQTTPVLLSNRFNQMRYFR